MGAMRLAGGWILLRIIVSFRVGRIAKESEGKVYHKQSKERIFRTATFSETLRFFSFSRRISEESGLMSIFFFEVFLKKHCNMQENL